MPRRHLAALSGIALFGLSCGITATAPVRLPPVSAQSASAARAPAAVPEADAEIVASVVRIMKRRRDTGLTEFEIEPLARTIVSEARRYDLDPSLVLAVIYVESRYRVFAVSPVGARGLMQIMPATGLYLAERLDIPWRGPQMLFDPFVNVRMGVAYLRELADRYGRIDVALAAYNWGPAHIDRRLRRGTPTPVEYPQLVFDAYDPPGRT